MSKIVKGLYYSKEHEWVKVDGNEALIGITDFAQDALGDLVYADCGTVGSVVAAGDAVAVLESVKAASDVYSPVSGNVIRINEELADAPEKINEDAFGNYIFAVELSDKSELDSLLDASAYETFCSEQ